MVFGTQSAMITVKDGANLFERKVNVIVKYSEFVPPEFSVFPNAITRTIKDTDETVQPSNVRVLGDAGQTWTAVADKDFLDISPESGDVGSPFSVAFDRSKLQEGLNEATITVKDGAGHHEITVPVQITSIKEGGEDPQPEGLYFPLVFVK